MAIETPEYKIIKRDGRFELREYSTYITASVEVKSDSHNTAGNQAFGVLADYIFGNNTISGKIAMTVPVSTQQLGSQKIAMTAPVDTSELSNGNYRVSFTMPASFSLKTLPKPNDSRVKIDEIKPHKAAAISFAGYTGPSKLSSMAKKLEDWCQLNNLKIVGSPVLSRFDAPWKPGFLRHNEVSFKIGR